MFDFLRYFLGTAIWFFVLGVGLWRGERPERIVSGVMLVGMLLTPIVQTRRVFDHPDWGVMIVDIIVTVIITWVALRSDRWWPLFCAAYHFIVIGIHLVRITRPDTSQFAYATVAIVFAYLGLFALGGGLIALEARRWRSARMSSA